MYFLKYRQVLKDAINLLQRPLCCPSTAARDLDQEGILFAMPREVVSASIPMWERGDGNIQKLKSDMKMKAKESIAV